MIEQAIKNFSWALMIFGWGCLYAHNREVNTSILFILAFIGFVTALVIQYKKNNAG